MDKIRQWMYYFVIGIVSMIALCFLPMIGSTAGLGWNTPNTFVGWIVWVTVKLIVAVLNVLIFHCFMLQAKINIKDNEKYLEAKQILSENEIKEFVPRSPNLWNRQQYGHKGVTIFITTALSTVALTQAMLAFDWMSMLTYLFTIIMGLIFGIMQMKTAEDYWTDEFWQYAQKVERDMELAKKEYPDKGNDIASSDCRDNILDSSVVDSDICTSNRSMVVGCSWDDLRFLGRSTDTRSTTSDSIYTICKENV